MGHWPSLDIVSRSCEHCNGTFLCREVESRKLCLHCEDMAAKILEAFRDSK